MKKYIVILLFCLMIFLLILNFKSPISVSEIDKSERIAEYLVSLYDTKYDAIDIDNKLNDLSEEDKNIVKDYCDNFVKTLDEDKLLSFDDWFKLSYINDGELNEYGEKVETKFVMQNGVKFYLMSDIIKENYSFTCDNVTYYFRKSDLPNYDGVLNNIEYSYMFKSYESDFDTVTVVYVSKLTGEELKYIFKYELFNGLIEIKQE